MVIKKFSEFSTTRIVQQIVPREEELNSYSSYYDDLKRCPFSYRLYGEKMNRAPYL